MEKTGKRINIRISAESHDKLLGLVFKNRKKGATIISVLNELLKVDSKK